MNTAKSNDFFISEELAKKIKKSKEPVQHESGEFVVVNVAEYTEQKDIIELGNLLAEAEEDFKEGRFENWDNFEARIRLKYGIE